MEKQYTKKLSQTSEISNRFRQLIKDHNMTQREFCKKTGISTGHLSKVLTGNAIPSGSMLISIAKEGFDVNFILSGVSYSEILSERESEIEKLKLIIEELRSIINFNMKQ
jgi:transcriptional regulator with XRE-family HTH domain